MSLTSQSDKLSYIPIVDISLASDTIFTSDSKVDEALLSLGKRLVSAFRDVGFVYLQDHSVPQEKISAMFKASAEFFRLPQETKMQYSKLMDRSSDTGYVSPSRETLLSGNPERKECFDFNLESPDGSTQKWPADFHSMKSTFEEFYELNAILARQILRLISIGLGYTKSSRIDSDHSDVGATRDTNDTLMRSLYYPQTDTQQDESQVTRCAEHTDYGTITILHQDSIGGLEVLSRSGEFVQVKPIPGTVVVNIADMFDVYTKDDLKSTVHRVRIHQTTIPRQSIAYFVHPNRGVKVRPLEDDITSMAGVSFEEHLHSRYIETGLKKA